MVALRNPADSQPAICPACGASVKMPGRAREARLQCPRCRQSVIFEKADAPSERAVEIPALPPAGRGQQEVRIEALEARILALESALAASAHAKDEPACSAKPPPVKRDRPADFSPEQAGILGKNLSGICAQEITLLFLQGDADTRGRAEWFKGIFEAAQWKVHCPEDPHLPHPIRCLTFVSRVPAGPEVAATYFAIRAAGFDLATENDPDLKETEQRLIVV